MHHQPCAHRYDNMPFRRCGRSGLLLPALSLGLYQHFTEETPFSDCRALVRHAFDRGVTHFDLANNYGRPAGSAETILGRILRGDLANHRHELLVTTKAGYDMWPGPYGEWGSRKYLLTSLDQSLERLGLDHVDIFYSHRFDPATPLEETMGALASAVQQGKALYVGISNYDAATSTRALAILRNLGTPCLVHQTSYSLLNRGIESDLLPLLGEEGVGAVVFQPLQRGLLSSSYLGDISPERRARLAGWNVPDSWIEKLPALAAIARARGQSLAQLAIAWTLRDPRISSALVGAGSVGQFDDSLAALGNLDFTADELAAIDRILA